MTMASIRSLPDEVLVQIFEPLDSVPPSELKHRQEPSLDLVRSAETPLKNASYVSKRWRSIILPLLFKHVRLHLDIPWNKRWNSCPACSMGLSEPANEGNAAGSIIEPHHVEMFEDFQDQVKNPEKKWHLADWEDRRFEDLATAREERAYGWARRLYHVLQDLCEFLRASSLELSVSSLVVLSVGTSYPGDDNPKDWRYKASQRFWAYALSRMQPDRVAVLAPPAQLPYLINAPVPFTENGAFQDTKFHLLELRTQPRPPSRARTRLVNNAMKREHFYDKNAGFATYGLLGLDKWTHLGLNEGSSLSGYGTLEFFERGQPHMVFSILHAFYPIHLSIRSFTYTGIFPFNKHANFLLWLQHLEELDVQFAPGLDSNILDDKDRVGKADLQDCWRDLEFAYQDIANTIDTFAIRCVPLPRLKQVTCRDFQIAAIRDGLDSVFMRCRLPVWVQREPGVFRRADMFRDPE